MRRVPSSPRTERFDNQRAELMRLTALYRDAVLRGKFRVSGGDAVDSLRRLVGPDCAYHLYRRIPVRQG